MSDYQPTPPQSTPNASTQYGGQGGPAQRTNVLAIVALILGIVVPIGGIICGHIALSQIKRTGENGHGLALAGTIIGYVLTVLGILLAVVYIIAIAALVNSGAISSTSP
jgi:hypothetical protein